ncbi:MAG: hypothetical protein NTV63_05385, partial [Candidatus Woesearchaeota archaeon]|nr:hypothetical protein [Candidatus Woesearchaeota archaeon]
MKIYEKGKKGDIAINAVMIGLITIASIFLLLMLFSLRMPAFAKQMYCKTFFHLHSASFMPEALRQDQDYCREQTALETYEIKPQDVIMRGLLNGGTSRRFDFIASNQFFQIGIEKKMEISKFSFALSGNASSIKIDVCPDGIIDFNITDMVPERKYYTDKALFDAFVNCSAKCHSFPCNVDFQIY